MSWTEAKIATLTRLWSEGVSARGIAEALGEVSRSAVLGKLHRLGLLKSRKAAAEPRRFGEMEAAIEADAVSPASIGRRRRRPPALPRAPWRAELFRPLALSQPQPWLERAENACAFPVSGGEAQLSCCAPTAPGRAYCAAHHAIMFKKPPALAVSAREISDSFETKRTAA